MKQTLLKGFSGFKKYFFPDVLAEEKRATIRMMRYVFLYMFLCLTLMIIVNLSWKEPWINIACPLAIITVLVAWLYAEKGHIQIPMLVVAILGNVLAGIGGTYGNGLHDISIVIFPATVIIASMILSRNLMIVLNAVILLLVAWLGYRETLDWIPHPPIFPGDPGDFAFIALVIIGASAWSMMIAEQTRRNLRQIKHNATHDYLTGCPNRALLFDRIDRIIRQQQRNPDLTYALLFFDLDGFKNVNDVLGHRRGDELIVAVARRIQGILRQSDTIARIGGDEFILLLPMLTSHEDALQVASRIQEEIQRPFELSGEQVGISASIGIVFGEQYTSADDLLIDADLAMYRAKRAGKARYQVFERSMRTQMHGEDMSFSMFRG